MSAGAATATLQRQPDGHPDARRSPVPGPPGGPRQSLSDALQPWDCQKSENRPDPSLVVVGNYDLDSVMHYFNNQCSYRSDLTTIDHCIGGRTPVQRRLDDGRIVTTITPGRPGQSALSGNS